MSNSAKKLFISFIGYCLAIASLSGWACGVCIEDKMALTYDHAVAQQTFARGDVLVFCELTGRVNTADLQKIIDKTRRLPGVQKNSVRTSSQPVTLSFALNPAIQPAATAIHTLQRTMPEGINIVLLNIMTGKR